MGQANPPRRIALVVEDDDYQRDLAVVLLEESDLNVIQCESAEAAELVVARLGEAISLVFTGVSLAGRMTGTELAEMVTERYPAIIVLVTSGDEVGDIPSGAVFLPKPWPALEILKHAERVNH
jgi:DNA-binding NtrC family response regulator